MKKIIFCGMLVLTCCLFKEAEIVEAGKTYNISGKCIPMSLSFGDKITANDACIAAGYGSCASVSGSYLGFTTCSNCEINALGLHGFPDPITGCNMVITRMYKN